MILVKVIQKNNMNNYRANCPNSFIFLDHILAVGDSSHANAELLDTSKWSWSNTAPYPFHSNVYQAPVLYNDEHFYIFGGYEYNRENSEPGISTIARFNIAEQSWTKVGDLKVKREGYLSKLSIEF